MNISHRRRFKVLGTFSFLFILSIAGISFWGAARSSAQERKYKVKTFKDMPVAVKEIRNLQKGEKWLRDLEIEIKNISDKPIYFIALTIEFPDIPPPAGAPENSVTGFPLLFGNRELGNVSKLAGPDDKAIKPGETYVFTIPEGRWTGFESMKQRMYLPPEATRNISIEFNTISFGDGTGFEGSGLGGKRDYRNKTSLNNKSATPGSTCQAPGLQEQLFRKISWKNSLTPLTTAAQDGCGSCARWRISYGGGPYCAYSEG